MPCIIRDKTGKVIQKSRNLAGIRRYVGFNIVRWLHVERIGEWEGKLSIMFRDGAFFSTDFASYSVLCGFVRNWRNVHMSPLFIQGEESGIVSGTNPAG